MACLNPIEVKTKSGYWTVAPCGQCIQCRIQKTREKSMRLLHELRYWKESCFLTLTYDDDHIPLTACGKSYLKYEDLKNFWKRLRDRLDYREFKYFAVGEYGELSKRCHFHAIVFGVGSKDLNEIKASWPFGFVKLGTVTADSCNYVCGYVQKKLTGIGKIKKFSCLPPEACRSSTGLGLRYAQDHEEQMISHGLTVKGKRVGIPRYYKDKLPFLAGVCDVRSLQYRFSEKFSDDHDLFFHDKEEFFRLRYAKMQESKARFLAHRSKKI